MQKVSPKRTALKFVAPYGRLSDEIHRIISFVTIQSGSEEPYSVKVRHRHDAFPKCSNSIQCKANASFCSIIIYVHEPLRTRSKRKSLNYRSTKDHIESRTLVEFVQYEHKLRECQKLNQKLEYTCLGVVTNLQPIDYFSFLLFHYVCTK